MLHPRYHWIPLPGADVRGIADLLRARDVCTPSFLTGGADVEPVDVYEPAVYRDQAVLHATDAVLRVDRNVLTRITGLARGAAATPEHRLAAAVLAFAQSGDVTVEPNLALYELAQTEGAGGQDAAVEELRLFRRADATDPSVWADVALGRVDQLEFLAPGGAVPAAGAHRDANVDFTMPLRRWRRNYVLGLQLAALELDGGDPSTRMSRLVRWMYDEFLLGGPALLLAAHYLAPNGPRKRLLKGLRAPERERAIRGVRNAAWDLTHISLWLEDVAQQTATSRLSLLTSFDVGLHRIARAVANPACALDIGSAATGEAASLRAMLVPLWGPAQGGRLADQIAASYARADAPERRINRPTGPDYVDSLIAAGEDALRGWSPGRSVVQRAPGD